jgi:hypothetical protein
MLYRPFPRQPTDGIPDTEPVSAIASRRPNPPSFLNHSCARTIFFSYVNIASGSLRTDRRLFSISSAAEPTVVGSLTRSGCQRSPGFSCAPPSTIPAAVKHFHYVLSVVYITEARPAASDFFRAGDNCRSRHRLQEHRTMPGTPAGASPSSSTSTCAAMAISSAVAPVPPGLPRCDGWGPRLSRLSQSFLVDR